MLVPVVASGGVGEELAEKGFVIWAEGEGFFDGLGEVRNRRTLNVQRPTFNVQRTLTPALSRSTGRGSKRRSERGGRRENVDPAFERA